MRGEATVAPRRDRSQCATSWGAAAGLGYFAEEMTLLEQGSGDSTVVQIGTGSSQLGDFWNLVEQAGPLRWPIFAVLAIGLALVISKLYELLKDRSASRDLFEFDLRGAGLSDITRTVSQQTASMLAALQSTMLNVFHTRPSEGMLHDEIANFVSFQQDQFGAFRRRMDFLADTAGALGLMGTVWGMFQVFFQGTSDKDVILRGMGIALITTLLGLVVSIILNLSATELSTFFGKRLEQVSRKSDELRFRLLELAPAAVPSASPARAEPSPPVKVKEAPPPATAPPPKAAPAPPATERAWYYLEAEPAAHQATAGDTLRGVALLVRSGDGRPKDGVGVVIAVSPGAGTLNGGRPEISEKSDGQGRVRFDWNVPEKAGSVSLTASVAGQPGSERRIDLQVEPALAHRVERQGNNQAAVAGMRLPGPLAVQVFDRFDNRVSGVPVTFQVTGGKGRLGQHGATVKVTTGPDGLAVTPFVVASEAGQNTIVATVEGQKTPVEFVAFGTEV